MKTFLEIDYWVQFLTLIFMAVTVPFFFIPMLALMFLGGWQLFSGLITGIFFKKLDRKYYLPKAIGYLAFLKIGFLLEDAGWLNAFNGAFNFITFVLIIPFCIGIWYYRMVRKDYHKYCVKPIVKSNLMKMNSPFEPKEIALGENRLFSIIYLEELFSFIQRHYNAA